MNYCCMQKFVHPCPTDVLFCWYLKNTNSAANYFKRNHIFLLKHTDFSLSCSMLGDDSSIPLPMKNKGGVNCRPWVVVSCTASGELCPTVTLFMMRGFGSDCEMFIVRVINLTFSRGDNCLSGCNWTDRVYFLPYFIHSLFLPRVCGC